VQIECSVISFTTSYVCSNWFMCLFKRPRTCCFHLQDMGSRQQVSPKHWFVSSRLNGFMSQKTAIFVVTLMSYIHLAKYVAWFYTCIIVASEVQQFLSSGWQAKKRSSRLNASLTWRGWRMSVHLGAFLSFETTTSRLQGGTNS
jgi:hypothetical protein